MLIEDIKRLVEIVLMALAAGWAIVGFFMLKQRQKAIADVRKVDLEAKKLELDLRQTANVEIEIQASSHVDFAATGYWVVVEVKLNNIGGRDTRIEWQGQPAPFSIRRTTFNAGGTPQFTSPPLELRARQARDPNSEPVSTILRAKGSQRLAFAARVGESGLYLLAFRASVGKREAEVSAEAGAQKFNPTSWTGTKFIVVPSTEAGHVLPQTDG